MVAVGHSVCYMCHPACGELVQGTYLELRNVLREEAKVGCIPVVSWTQFRSCALLCNIPERSIARAAMWMRANGDIFVAERDPTESNGIVLDLEWMNTLVTTVVTSRHTYARHGLLQHSALPQIWRMPDFDAEQHQRLLQLLFSWALVYPNTMAEGFYAGHSLVPLMLPDSRPDGIPR